MRLTDWSPGPPGSEAIGPKVLAVVQPVLRALCGDRDPEVWIAWGDDPDVRYVILAPVPAGLVTCHVRVNVPGEGPRASAKLGRWPRVQIGELAIEAQSGHRLISFQIEGQVIRGAGDVVDRVAAFALTVFAAMDGRPAASPSPVLPSPDDPSEQSIPLPPPRASQPA